MTLARARVWVLFVALAAYVNTLGNGFAYDDNPVVLRNPVVAQGQWGEALLGRYWRDAPEGSGLYRPVTIAAFTAEWGVSGGAPAAFHTVNVALHAAACVLVLALLAHFVAVPAALAGALLFAIHPVHVEAVANVVGQAELLSAIAVLAACLLYLGGGVWSSGMRAVRLTGLALLYLLGLGAKEIAVTLPGLLVLLEVARPRAGALRTRLLREAPVFLALGAVLAAYLVLRLSVLGTITGEVPAPALRGLSAPERVLTAFGTWPEYVRLMVFPLDLSADYAPAVLSIARGPTATVVLGALVLAGWLVGAVVGLHRRPVVGLGAAWFAVAVLPVSNLFFPAGVLLAERTLYLPSVGLALVVAGLADMLARAAVRKRRAALLGAAALGALLFVRTALRNPTWMSSYTVLNTLAVEHPESYMALRHRAEGLERVGEPGEAARAYDASVSLAPRHYGLLTEAGGFFARLRQDAHAEELLRRAVEVTPDQPTAYRLLAELFLRTGRGREAHATALQGLARSGPDRELWSLVSEAYIAKGDLDAAVRARRAALAVEPGSVHDWNRLADLLEATGRTEQAGEARRRAGSLDAALDTVLIPTPEAGS